MTSGEHWIGIDLGARVDRSAIVVVEALVVHTKTNWGDPVGTAKAYSNGQSEEVPTYAKVTERRDDAFQVAEIIRLDQGAPHSETLARLIDVYDRYSPRRCHFDDTGLGVGFHEYVMSARDRLIPMPRGVTFTVATKYDVISALDRLVDEGRIRVPDQPGADKLRQELSDYRYRYTAAGNVTTGSATVAAHDDLVIAAALAVYPVSFHQRPSPGGSSGYMAFRPCRVVKRIEHLPMPNPKENTHA